MGYLVLVGNFRIQSSPQRCYPPRPVGVDLKPDSKSNKSAEQKRFLSLTEVPFLLTIFIGLLCWSVTYFSDAIKKSPTVYYTKINADPPPADGGSFYFYTPVSQKQIAPRDSKEAWIKYEVTNLTRDQVFKDISFYIITDRGRLIDPLTTPIAPAKVSDRSASNPNNEETTIEPYRLPEFHPGWRFRLQALLITGATQKDTKISFDYSDRGDAGKTLNVQVVPVRFVKFSPETFIAEHDFEIIEAIFAISLIVIVLYAVSGAKNR